MAMKATNVRISTAERNVSRQLEGKDGEIYWDKISGMVPFEDRPNSVRLLGDAISVLEAIKTFTYTPL